MSNVSTSRQLIERLQRAERLPSPPGVALRIVELCRRENSTARELTDVLSTDASLTARLLKYANCPMSGIGRKITSPAQAVQYLGFRTVQVIALGFSLPTTRGVSQCRLFDVKRFWTQSFITGVLARQLAQRIKCGPPEEAFTAGLLANFGRLALAHGMPEDYSTILEHHQQGIPLADAERHRLGTDHLEVGAELLRLWGIPDRLLTVLEFVGRPEESPGSCRDAANIVGSAYRLAGSFIEGGSELPVSECRACVEALGLSAAQWEELSTTVVDEYRQLRSILEMDLEPDIGAVDLFAEAHKESTRLAMTQQLESNRLAQTQADLLHRASTDALTQLDNRAKFDECLNDLLKDAKRGHREYALLLIDIDHFKKINDTHGHTAGDRALMQLASTLKSALRDTDIVARYGGDEFAIILRHVDRATASHVADRIVQNVRRNPLTWLEHTINLTVSVGVAFGTDFADAPDPGRVIALADEQLYTSKHRGRNTWTCRAKAA